MGLFKPMKSADRTDRGAAARNGDIEPAGDTSIESTAANADAEVDHGGDRGIGSAIAGEPDDDASRMDS